MNEDISPKASRRKAWLFIFCIILMSIAVAVGAYIITIKYTQDSSPGDKKITTIASAPNTKQIRTKPIAIPKILSEPISNCIISDAEKTFPDGSYISTEDDSLNYLSWYYKLDNPNEVFVFDSDGARDDGQPGVQYCFNLY